MKQNSGKFRVVKKRYIGGKTQYATDSFAKVLDDYGWTRNYRNDTKIFEVYADEKLIYRYREGDEYGEEY